MAVFFNGFDFFNGSGTDQLQSVWDAGSGVSSISTLTGGAFAYGRSAKPGSTVIYKTLANIPASPGANWSTLYFCYHWYPNAFYGDDTVNWVQFIDNVTIQAVLRITSLGIIKLYRGSGTTLLATGLNAITAGAWNWVAGKIVFNNSTGSCTLNLNRVQQFAVTGVDTCATANDYATRIGFSRPYGGSAGEGDIDNVHLYDGSDPAPFNAIAAERRVYFQMPTGDGALTAWTASSGADYQCVDENPPTATDYISSSTVGQQTTITKAASGVGVIDAVQVWINAQKDDATARGVKIIARDNGGTLYYGAENSMLSGWTYFLTQWYLDPGTAAAWAVADFDNYQFGVEVTT